MESGKGQREDRCKSTEKKREDRKRERNKGRIKVK
jgi:hypothetical protein